MDALLETVCLGTYLLLTLVPAGYGLHLCILVALVHRRARSVSAAQRAVIRRFAEQTPDPDWPVVTTQIPLYNELWVSRRVIEAVAGMDYPAGRHEVQVLDDSTDETRDVVDRVCAELRAAGRDVTVVRRPTREHYKAGALAHGLKSARGEYIAVFDADFVPDRGFLRRMIPLIASAPDVGCVQARWGHLNGDQNWMTEAIALGIDGHFAVEQGARAWNNLLLNFNGTGGIWRRKAIEDPRVGGWQGDTITEDLDLSYRAQLAGWKIVYCRDEVCPAEVPADADTIKTQQRRWATGSIQTARKLLPAVWRSRLPLVQKLEATVHLLQYGIAVFMVLIPLLARFVLIPVPLEEYADWLAWCWVAIPVAAVAPSAAYIYGRWSLGGGATGPLRILKLIVLGLGLSVNNCTAVLTGLVQRGGEFVRTPKSGSTDGSVRQSTYSAIRSNLWLVELLFGVFCFAQWALFLPHDRYVFGTFFLLYAIGLVYMGWESRPRPSPLTPAVASPGGGPKPATA